MFEWLIGALPYIQIILSFLLVILIIFQKSEAGVGGAFGGGDTTSTGHQTRRGFDKFLFYVTIVVAVLFIATIVAPIFI